MHFVYFEVRLLAVSEWYLVDVECGVVIDYDCGGVWVLVCVQGCVGVLGEDCGVECLRHVVGLGYGFVEVFEGCGADDWVRDL